MNIQKKKIVLIASALFLLGFIIFSLYIKIDQNGKIKTTISVIPADATVLIDKKSYPTEGTIHLSSGLHTVEIKKDGFEAVTAKINIAEEENIIVNSLTPVSGEAIAWAEKHQDLYAKNTVLGSESANQRGEAQRNKNKIIEKLPHKTLLYDIGYKLDPSDETGNSIIVTVHASPGYQQYAIRQIIDWGYDPALLKIYFANDVGNFGFPLGDSVNGGSNE